MNWIFVAFFGVSVLHMIEEYFFPGGFMDFMKRMNPAIAPRVTVPSAIIINGLQLALCLAAVIVRENALVSSLSPAGLLFFNGWTHVGASILSRGYAPGVITGVLLYLPLSIYAYAHFLRSGQLTWNGLALSGALAILYQLVPAVYFGLSPRFRRT